MEGHDLVLLTTAGAKTGLPRTVVLVYFTIDDRMIVVGSKGGAPTHPDWVFNVRADPRAHAETAAASFDVVAHELSEADNASTYRRIIEREPRFGAYKEMTAGIRTIPLFELTRPITHRS